MRGCGVSNGQDRARAEAAKQKFPGRMWGTETLPVAGQGPGGDQCRWRRGPGGLECQAIEFQWTGMGAPNNSK